MDYKKEIAKILKTIDEKQLKIIYQFVMSISKKKA